MQPNDADAATASEEYARRRPLYEELANEICFALSARLKEKSTNVVSITGRAKTVESFREKIARKAYSEPLAQMTDLAGVRVVCNYEADLTEIVEVICAEFVVHEITDRSDDLGVEKMGYHGRHFIVSFGNRYAGVRYEKIISLRCEIQARTILQDAWAIISHSFTYKAEASVPIRLRRDLNNVSSLLEIAQGVFDTVNEKQMAYRTEIAHREPDKFTFLSQAVDFETLLAYTRWKFPELSASEHWNDRLAQDIDVGVYPTLAHVDSAVERAKYAVAAYKAENPGWFKTGTDHITKALGFVDKAFRDKHSFAPQTREAFHAFEHLVKPAKKM